MFKKVSYLFFALALLVGAQAFMGCDANSGDDGAKQIPMPEALKGTWVSTFLENYSISGTQFSSLTNEEGYVGTIVNVRGDIGDSTAGYITIRYTKNTSVPGYYPGQITETQILGRYYVIRYTSLTPTSVSLSAAYNGSDGTFGGSNGKATQQEAEDIFIVTNGYFGMSSACVKAGPATYNSPVIGEWGDASYNVFSITNKTVGYSYYYAGMLIGDIVAVRPINSTSGYITFQYTYAPLDTSLVGYYCVLYYEVVNTTTVKLAIFNSTGNFGEDGEADQATAESLYVISNSTYYDAAYDLLTCTKTN